MSPPLIQLTDIALTFGGTPLLEGVELSVSAGERVCLVGRNGSGKSTLLKIAAGLVEPDSGERFVQPGAAVRYLPQEPDLSGFASTLAYVESGLGPTDDPHKARHLLELLGLSGSEHPAQLSGGEARRAALAHVLAPARYPAARRAHQPSGPAGHRVAGSPPRPAARRAGADLP
jgi:ATP-binding cassette subfamily F protein uup